MEKDFFEIIVEYFMNERLGDILMKDERYIEVQNKIWQQTEWFKNSEMTEEQHMAVEELLLLHIRSINAYAKKAYEYGFRDCISVLRKLDIIKTL